MAAAALRRRGRPAACGADAGKRDPPAAHRARLSFRRPARRRQDHARAHLRQGDELSRSAGRRAVLPLRILPCDRGGAQPRRDGGGRRQPQHHRRYARTGRRRADPAGRRPLQNLHHRRSPHALQAGVERAAENGGGAARPCEVHLCDHRSPSGPADDHFALPAVRSAADPDPADHGAAAADLRLRASEDQRQRDRRDRPGRRGRHARRPEPARPDDRVLLPG